MNYSEILKERKNVYENFKRSHPVGTIVAHRFHVGSLVVWTLNDFSFNDDLCTIRRNGLDYLPSEVHVASSDEMKEYYHQEELHYRSILQKLEIEFMGYL